MISNEFPLSAWSMQCALTNRRIDFNHMYFIANSVTCTTSHQCTLKAAIYEVYECNDIIYKHFDDEKIMYVLLNKMTIYHDWILIT